jgi:hypothetical protein
MLFYDERKLNVLLEFTLFFQLNHFAKFLIFVQQQCGFMIHFILLCGELVLALSAFYGFQVALLFLSVIFKNA